MIKTYGLTHVALAVKEAKRSFEFYRKVFGVENVYDKGTFIQAQTPGTRDVLVFDEKAKRKGERGGIEHFGFRLKRPEDVDLAAELAKKAGGTILDKGEFCPGEPYLYCADPDGYVVEIWYELPTAVDPKR
jgi:catechol 2,3-dioxygenase-like lactoylglutathione lyase family enzyme